MRRPGGIALPGRTAAITAVISGRTPHKAACTGAARGTTTTSFCAPTRAWVVRVGCGTQCVSPASSASTPRSAATSTVPSLAYSTVRPHRRSRACSACAPQTTTGRTRWTCCVLRRWACRAGPTATLPTCRCRFGSRAAGTGAPRAWECARAPSCRSCAHCPHAVCTLCVHTAHAVCALRLR